MTDAQVNLKRIHARRLREVYRSAGWPSQDLVEIELLAAGLLERMTAKHWRRLATRTSKFVAVVAEAVACLDRHLAKGVSLTRTRVIDHGKQRTV